MSDLNVALVLRLIDQMTGPSGRVVDAFKRMRTAAGEFRKGFGEAMREGFSVENIEAALQRNEAKVRAARGRLVGAFGMGLTLAAPVMAAGNFEEELIQFGNLADLDREKLQALGRELDALSRRDITGQSSSTLLKGLETYVGKGMDVDAALEALPATARAAKATGAAFDEMAAAGFAAMDNLGVAPADLAKALDIMAASGKEGSFELRDMARSFPELTASAKALGMEGTKGVASLAAALQIAMKSAGSADQAANNTANFLGKLTTPDAVKKFAEAGVNIQQELEGALARGADPLEHMLTVIERITGGDQFKMGELFADKQVLDFLRAAIPNLNEYRRIMESTASAEGIIDADYARNMEGFNESLRQLRLSFQGLLGGASPLLPILTDLLQGATAMVDKVRDWTAANPELTAFLVKGAAGMLAFGIGTRVLGYAFAVGRGNLIRFAALFFKFTAEGRNISVIARALRGLGRGLSWARIIPKLSWRALNLPRLGWGLLVNVLNWVPFIPKIAWHALKLPKLAWDLVIGLLNWGLFIPRKLLLRDFGPGVTQIGPAMQRAAAQTEASAARINRALRGIMWRGALAGGLMYSLARSVPTDIDELRQFREDNGRKLEEFFRSTPGISHMMSGYEWLSGKIHGEPDAGKAAAPQAELPVVRAQDVLQALSVDDLRAYLGTPHVAPPAGQQGATSEPARPPARPEAIKVEETVNHDYKADHTVTVTVPVTIQQHIRANAAELSREIGARTERATRRALSDAMIPE